MSPFRHPLVLVAITLATSVAFADIAHEGIHVTGQGTIQVPPDQVTIVFLAEHRQASGKVAYAQTQALTRRLIETAQTRGIAAEDLEASGIALHPEYGERKDNEPPQMVASATVTVTLRRVEGLDELMDAMITAGALVTGSPQPGLQDPDAARARALELAITDARTQAGTAAALLDLRLGAATRVAFQSPGIEQFRSSDRVMAMESRDGPTYLPGKIPVSQSVEITFAILPEN